MRFMRVLRSLALFAIFALAGAAPSAEAEAIISASSCSVADVQAAVNSAREGDVVAVPSGSCTWTASLSVSTGIVLKGAGIDRTVIVDDAPRSTIEMATAAGNTYRITGFTFRRGSGVKLRPFIINITGNTRAFRIDHNKFDHTAPDEPHTRAIYTGGAVLGVIDHNEFISSGGLRGAIDVDHASWGGGRNDYGDGSWADDSHWGTEKFVFIEDNVFTGPPGGHFFVTDAASGGRYVFRHNRATNGTAGTHGTEAGNRVRGVRAVEVYRNHVTHVSWPAFLRMRGGTALVFDNVANGFGSLVILNNGRSKQNYGTWKACDGTDPFDINDGVIYDSGTHNGPSGADDLTDTTKAWTANRWSQGGHSVRNVTKGNGGYALSNTATKITMTPHTGTWRRFDRGDKYVITRATVCMDAPGSGKGALLSGYDPVPKASANQVRDPIYVWNNVHNEGLGNSSVGTYFRNPHMVEGRDYFNNIPKPGYTPFVYPHPLVSGGAVPPTPAPRAPTNLKVQ
jgi:hypothetical protein